MKKMKERAEKYIATQQSLHLYKETREAFVDVLSVLPEKDFKKLTDNLILMVLHQSAIAQVMHFEPTDRKFQVLQLTIPDNITPDAFRWVIAHELGHVMQGRNWRESDGEEGLEDDATECARKWGFEKPRVFKGRINK